LRDDRLVGWRIRGSYFESCNCDVICPCRRVNGVPGGRSTHGVCMGALSWLIEEGSVDGLDVGGLPVAIAFSYSDDAAGSPWTWFLYLSSIASPDQRTALEAVYTGSRGGDALEHFPWAWKAAELIAVRPAVIEVDHTPRRQFLRVRDEVTVRIRERYAGDETVSCVVPGHDRPGEELIAGELRVDDEPLAFDFDGVCGYASTFDYSG
jgi:hypothetical protein